MKKVNVKKLSFILIPVVSLCLIPSILIYKSVSSSRIILKDQAKSERILLHNAKGGHACHCFPPMIANNPGFQILNITATSADFRWPAARSHSSGISPRQNLALARRSPRKPQTASGILTRHHRDPPKLWSPAGQRNG